MKYERHHLLGTDLTIPRHGVGNYIVELAKQGCGYVCISNVHQLTYAVLNQGYRNVLSCAVVIPDSQVLGFSLRILYGRSAKNASSLIIRGDDVVYQTCEACQSNGISVGFYGGTEISLNLMKVALKKKFPDLKVDYLYSPGYDSYEQYIDKFHIEQAAPQILFVGLGCPKQEIWMYRNRHRLPSLMIGVGAAFDLISGEKVASPKWVHKCGMDWLYRLFKEPRRLWKRYFFYNTIYIFLYFFQFLKFKLKGK